MVWPPMGAVHTTWSCSVCGGTTSRPAFRSSRVRGQIGAESLQAESLRPASSAFGSTLGEVVRCRRCRHGSLRETPSSAQLDQVYAHVEDGSSLLEEQGQTATARRDLEAVAKHLGTDRRRLLDIGCWTGSLLGAAAELGWEAEGIDPSAWAVERAVERGHHARRGVIGDPALEPAAYQVITCCDVLEHLVDPASAVEQIFALLEPGGLLFATVPDGGSALARVLGHRWWSVLPMHVQYFTRRSLRLLLEGAGLEVESMRTHPKVFTRGYYANRFGEFVPAIGPRVAGVVTRSRHADRPFAPDFHDRVAVIARRP